MIFTLLITLILLDLGLLVTLYFFYKKNLSYEDLLSDIEEERTLLNKMQGALQTDLSSFEDRSKKTLEKMSKLAAEIEQEIEGSSKRIADGVSHLLSDVSKNLDPLFLQLSEQKNSVEISHRKIEKEKMITQKLLARLEILFQFFNEKVPYESILKDLETKKYSDARHLLTQGYDAENVSKELGLRMSEVELMKRI
ncbi:MAG: hypothetical protein KA436_02520 [Oligoflexales bacterium]|nr:hypothetical protein [Oligoflexales bacterium]